MRWNVPTLSSTPGVYYEGFVGTVSLYQTMQPFLYSRAICGWLSGGTDNGNIFLRSDKKRSFCCKLRQSIRRAAASDRL